jgi:hypothetical protein
MATNPRIRIREATPADVDAIVDIHFAAFDEDVMNQLMYPGGASADSRQKFGSKVLPQTAAQSGPDTTTPREQNFLCVAEYLSEDGPGEVVAFAKWLLHREPRTEEEQKAQVFNATTETSGQGCDIDVVNAFIGGMNRLQWDHAKGEAALCKSPTLTPSRYTANSLPQISAFLRAAQLASAWGPDRRF